MEVAATNLDGVLRLRPKVFRDERGFFLESWNKREFDSLVGAPSISCRTISVVPCEAFFAGCTTRLHPRRKAS